jgi:putative glycosyltransferase (TIGR04372 family)
MTMSMKIYIKRQLLQIKQGGWAMLFRKMKIALQMLLQLPLCILAVPVVLVVRLISPWLLVRWGGLDCLRIGHFVGIIEMYLCERDAGINVPKQRYIDIFYMGGPVCNQQLASMWKRVLHIWPTWILAPVSIVNRLIPGSTVYEIGNNKNFFQDMHNFLDRFQPHLEFTPEEEARGEDGLRAMGIPQGAPFVCLNVRDNAYLIANVDQLKDWSYQNYRDCDIQNYIMSAEELADQGYFVIRMGAKVNNVIKSSHSKIIDYATNGMRSDFMDIYLGAKCKFCISTGTGWDNVPVWGFRRPTLYTNLLPIGYTSTSLGKFIFTTKRHIFSDQNRELTLREIFNHDVGFSLHTSDYESKGIKLIENTPGEIRDVVIEMAERLNGTWQPHEDDEALQRRFWEIFPVDTVDASGRPMHGEIRARYGAHFLRNNREWLR